MIFDDCCVDFAQHVMNDAQERKGRRIPRIEFQNALVSLFRVFMFPISHDSGSELKGWRDTELKLTLASCNMSRG